MAFNNQHWQCSNWNTTKLLQSWKIDLWAKFSLFTMRAQASWTSVRFSCPCQQAYSTAAAKEILTWADLRSSSTRTFSNLATYSSRKICKKELTVGRPTNGFYCYSKENIFLRDINRAFRWKENEWLTYPTLKAKWFTFTLLVKILRHSTFVSWAPEAPFMMGWFVVRCSILAMCFSNDSLPAWPLFLSGEASSPAPSKVRGN